MTRIRVHELAKELGKQNREIMELLRAEGIDVKSHMSNVEESQAAVIRKKNKGSRKGERDEIGDS